MKAQDAILLFAVVFAAALAANLIALKIASDQASAALDNSPANSLLKLFAPR